MLWLRKWIGRVVCWLQVTLEYLTWVPVLALGPLWAPGKASQIQLLPGVARYTSWTSLGPLGVGTPSSQAALYLVNLPNLLCGFQAET